jgi:nucleoside-diphosphate-sugar epimerase
MRILVIGGSGFIGSRVVRYLGERGHDITIFHRGETESSLPPGARHLYGDRRRLATFADDFGRLDPEVVIDMVPITESDARGVMDTFAGVARRVVAISSADVYRAYGVLIGIEGGSIEPVPISEDAPLRERLYPYRGKIEGMHDYEKILVERTVMDSPDLPGTVLRLGMVYGPGDRQHRLRSVLSRMDDGRAAIILEAGLAAHRGSRVYVDNAAAAIALAATDDRATGRVYNVAEPDALPEAEWVRLIGRVASWNGEVLVLGGDQLPEPLKPGINTSQHLLVDTTRIRAELGYSEAIPREEAVRRTIDWERSQRIDAAPIDYAAEDAVLARIGE